MTTNTICIVNGIRLQKPSPNAPAVSSAGAPLPNAATATSTTPSAANANASGNQRSAHAADRSAKRATPVSCAVSPMAVSVGNGPLLARCGVRPSAGPRACSSALACERDQCDAAEDHRHRDDVEAAHCFVAKQRADEHGGKKKDKKRDKKKRKAAANA